MRWTRPVPGDTRVIRRFFVFPQTIDRTVYWMESAWVFERLSGGCIYSGTGPIWHTERLATEDEIRANVAWGPIEP